MQSINGSRVFVVDGSPSEVLVFFITEGIPAYLDGDIMPSFIRYDGNLSSSLNFSLPELTFFIGPVDMYEDEGNYTLCASNLGGFSQHTVYLDVQSK